MLTKKKLVKQLEDFPFHSNNYLEFLKLASSQEVEDLDKIGLIYLAPESFSLNVIRDILEFLEKRGVVFLDAAIVNEFTEEDIAHHIPRKVPDSLRWWIVQRRFTFGPVGALLVSSKHKQDTPFPKLLKEIKGFRIPFKGDDKSLRKLLPSINGKFNLIHTSDDGSNLLRDSEPFYSAKHILKAIYMSNLIHKGKAEALSIDHIINNFFSGYLGYKSYCTSFQVIYICILLRIIARIILNNKPYEFLIKIQNSLNNCLQEYKIMQTDRHNFNQLLAIQDQLQSEFPNMIISNNFNTCCKKTKILLKLFNKLLDLERATQVDWLKYIKALESCDVKLNDWEEIILISTLYNIDEEVLDVKTNPINQ